MNDYVAALDQGTTSTRFMVFDRQGKVISVDQREHQQIFPQPGWVEHNPLEIWENTEAVIRSAMRKAGLSAEDLAAIGITNQRETSLVWNRNTGIPYSNAIVWQDTRTDTIINQLAEHGGQDRFREQTGLPLATYFSGPKLMWLLENIPGLREEAGKGDAIFGNMDTWLIWNLTGGVKDGVHITDVSNASRTMLMNLETLTWDKDILAVMDIPMEMLPEIRPSSDPNGYGMTANDGPLEGEVLVSGDLGDQQAALFGQTCFLPGEAKNTYGTGCFMLLNTGAEIVKSEYGLLTTLGYQIADNAPVYALEGSVANTGSVVQWLRDNLGLIEKSAEIESLAASVEDNGGMYFVPAFSGLYAPYWRSDARGVMAGLTRYINKGHLARAALEAAAFQTREVLEAMEKDSGTTLNALKVDGGMVVNDFLMQFQADILGIPVVCPQVIETTSLGAAYAAGMAVGYWKNLDDLRENWAVSKEWTPQMDENTRANQYKNWLKAVERTFDWVE